MGKLRRCALAVSLLYEATAAAALEVCMALKCETHERHKYGTVTSYLKVVKYLTETYARGKIVPETDADRFEFTQASNEWPMGNVEALWNKVLQHRSIWKV